MQSLLRLIRTKFYKWTEPVIKIPINSSWPVTRFGTSYGGWIIPKNAISTDSICYLVGAGEDISFDLAIAQYYNCNVHIFDPTPRALQHFNTIVDNIKASQKTPCVGAPGGYYPEYPTTLVSKLNFHPLGIWNENTTLRFFAPSNDAYVSHSLVNLQQTEQYIEVPVRSLKSIMEELGHTRLNLLKIDIEGAEYQVIESIVADRIEVDILCVEFDESAANHFDRNYIQRIEASLQSLIEIGFQVIAKEASCYNYTLLHERCM